MFELGCKQTMKILSHQCKQRINMLKSVKHKCDKTGKTGLRMEKGSSLPRIFYLALEEDWSVLWSIIDNSYLQQKGWERWNWWSDFILPFIVSRILIYSGISIYSRHMGILPFPCLQLGEASSGIYKVIVFMHLFASTDEGPILNNSNKIIPSSILLVKC